MLSQLLLKAMECKSITKATAAIFLAFLLLGSPHFPKGVGGSEDSDSEIVYDIDYKGPETHSSVPPPNYSLEASTNHQNDIAKVAKFKASRSYATRRDENKVRG